MKYTEISLLQQISHMIHIVEVLRLVDWLVVLRIYVALAVFQSYCDLEAGDNQSLKIQMARPGIEPWTSFSASQELNHSATAAPLEVLRIVRMLIVS